MLNNPKIILVLSGKETNQQIKRYGVDMLELRADLLPKLNVETLMKEISKRKPLKLPLLLTVRNQKEEGAAKVFVDQDKWALFEAALPHVDLVDIELTSPLLKQVVSLAHRLKKRVIVSSHYFNTTPSLEHLEGIFRQSKAAGADVTKIAAYAKDRDDLWAMMRFTQGHRDESIITIAMGQQGKISRLILPLLGSQFTYSFIGSPQAPGQVDVRTLKEHLIFYK